MRKIILLSLMTFLSGCASMNSKFNCPLTGGVTCKSVGQVNQMVDSGQLGNTNRQETDNNSVLLENKTVLVADDSKSQLPPVNHAFGEPIRNNETIMRVWLAPYQDSIDNYHQQTFVYAITKKGQWIAQKKQ